MFLFIFKTIKIKLGLSSTSVVSSDWDGFNTCASFVDKGDCDLNEHIFLSANKRFYGPFNGTYAIGEERRNDRNDKQDFYAEI
jgi:hypothetical protein